MSKEERADIMDVVKNLPDNHKQFLLGYAAGVSASTKPENKDATTETTTENGHD